MKDKVNLKGIFTPTRHLTRDELMRYVMNTMTRAEVHRVERHLVDCHLCSEAMNGIASLGNASSYYNAEKSLRKIARRRKLIGGFNFSAVQVISVVAILFLILFLILFAILFFMK